jgi:hypothetical protein
MPKTILKVNLSDRAEHELPMGAEIIHVGYRGAVLYAWALCDEQRRKISHTFLIAGNDWTIPDFVTRDKFVGTVISRINGSMWHVFMLGYTANLSPFQKREIEQMELAK